MYTKTHYVPAIRWGKSEREALKELSPALRARMIPLIDITPTSSNFVAGSQSRTIDRYLDGIPSEIAASWGKTNPLFVDLGLLDGSIKMTDGSHPLDDLFARMGAAELQAIPVTGTGRGIDYQAAVAAIHRRDRRGVCIRARVEDLADTAAQGEVGNLIEALGIEESDADLILDLRSIEGWQAQILRVFVTSILTSMPKIYDFRTVTLLAGAFPMDLSNAAEGVSLVPRSDWNLWRSVKPDTQFRLPYFGDYTARHPDQNATSARSMQVIVRIRYVAESYWVIVKDTTDRDPGRAVFGKVDTDGADQAHPLAKNYDSFEDSESVLRRAVDTRIGSTTSDLKVATILHLARTAQQIATLR